MRQPIISNQNMIGHMPTNQSPALYFLSEWYPPYGLMGWCVLTPNAAHIHNMELFLAVESFSLALAISKSDCPS